jgi:lipopolysaccharide/colanic/teichoic acid biosynthesis glycosyltransferase
MLTDTITIGSASVTLRRSEEIVSKETVLSRKCDLTFLYIGKNKEAVWYFSSFFKTGFFAESFIEACLLLKKLTKENSLPDSIIIDLPFKSDEIVLFYNRLNQMGIAEKTPLLYSDRILSESDIRVLSSTPQIDDVLNINDWAVNYAAKLSFLTKIKKQQAPLNTKIEQRPVVAANLIDGNMLLKRLFDITVSLTLILLFAPVFLLIALAIRLESKGPVFYNSLRAGRNFKIFRFFKFRTMEVDADKKVSALEHLNQYAGNEKGAKFLKICNDPRVTKVGKFLRNTSLDELPQLFNVLKGDMSLVGNRPLPLYEASTLTTDDCVERFMAPAGITGLWQVKKRSNLNMSTEERIQLDITYARKYSFLYDMWIVLQTPGALFQKTNV